jgi:hypothetical protein
MTAVFTVEPEALDPEGDYLAHVDPSEESDWEMASFKEREPSVFVIGDVLAMVNSMGEAMALVSRVVAQPYALRTTDDVPAVLHALRDVLAGTSDTIAGLGQWLEMAQERGETRDTGPARQRLAGAVGAVRKAWDKLGLDAPTDASPGMALTDIAEGVTKQLQARGVAVGHVHVADDATAITWYLPGPLMLSLSGGDLFTWDLLRPAGGDAWANVRGCDLPMASYAHPGQVADAVARYMSASTR